MENVIIRFANKKDLNEILLLSDKLTLADLPFDREVDINWAHTENGKKYYTEKINKTNGVCFIADLKGEVVGYLTAGEMEIPTYRKVTVSEITNVFVKEAFRSKGVGKMLMEAFKNWAKEKGSDKIAVNVFALNEKAIKFYKREGLIPQDMTLEMNIK